MNVDKKERFLLFNSLAILLKAVEGEKTTIDLRNEASVYGTVRDADGYMNVVMTDCVFTDPRGDSFAYDMFFVQSRNIRYVHIPTHIKIIPSIKDQLKLMSHKNPQNVFKKRTFKAKRAAENQAKDLAAVKKILGSKQDVSKPSKSDT